MTRAAIHREEVPAGTPYAEWINISGGWLHLDVPGLLSLNLCPEGRIQIPCADLAWVEAWLEGLELRGALQVTGS